MIDTCAWKVRTCRQKLEGTSFCVDVDLGAWVEQRS